MTSELTSSEYFELIGELIPELTSSQFTWKGNQKGKGTDETPQSPIIFKDFNGKQNKCSVKFSSLFLLDRDLIA